MVRFCGLATLLAGLVCCLFVLVFVKYISCALCWVVIIAGCFLMVLVWGMLLFEFAALRVLWCMFNNVVIKRFFGLLGLLSLLPLLRWWVCFWTRFCSVCASLICWC